MPYKERHHCQLHVDSMSMLPKLHPNASRFRKLLRNIRKLFLVSPYNPKTKAVFRSQASIRLERRRHIKLYPIYVIHPYSFYTLLKEIVMCISWFLYFSVDSFKVAFVDSETEREILTIVKYFFDFTHFSHIVVCFFSGYRDKARQEIVLDPKTIVRHYLRTYFFWDVPILIPADIFFKDKRWYWIGFFLHMSISPRFITMTRYFRQITLLMDVGDVVHELLCLILGALFLVHWWAVLIYALPRFRYSFTEERTPFSWIQVAKISADFNTSTATRYVQSLHKACALFLGCSKGMWTSSTPTEWLVFSLIILSGTLYVGYITAIVLQLSTSCKMSESMYDKMTFQLFQYTKAKKLPDRLKMRLRLYYEARFREKFFKETSILSTLSEHLRYEIIYYNCKRFIQTTWFFEHLPKAIVGHVIASMSSTVLITNEVVFTEEEYEEPKLYFIASGSVALYADDGTELLHIEDGDYFGEHNILLKITNIQLSNITKNMRAVVAEITELFVLRMSDFIRYVGHFPQAMNRIKQVAQVRDNLNVVYVKRKRAIESHGMVTHLRVADFLSTGRLRKQQSKRYGAEADPMGSQEFDR